MADGGYSSLLRAAIDRAGSSRRKLSFYLAEMTGNQQTSEYRALGKYLSGDEVPGRDRAAILAVALNEPKLALVIGSQLRRQDRLAELAETVDKLEEVLDQALTRIEDLEARVAGARRRGSGAR